jgi:hypothetical protein
LSICIGLSSEIPDVQPGDPPPEIPADLEEISSRQLVKLNAREFLSGCAKFTIPYLSDPTRRSSCVGPKPEITSVQAGDPPPEIPADLEEMINEANRKAGAQDDTMLVQPLPLYHSIWAD